MDERDLEQEMGRRGILAVSVWSILGVIGGGVASILGFSAIAPLREKNETEWLDAGPETSLGAEPHRLDVSFKQRQGWSETTRTLVFYAYKDEQGRPVALSTQCPHLGCAVRWTEKSSSFECPCHGGRFDKGGTVLAGPPAAPLTRPRVRIENSRLLIERT